MKPTLLGIVYDLDDTLLDNQPEAYAPHNLHEVSRTQATRAVGERYNIPELRDITYEQNLRSVSLSKEHSMDGVTWSVLELLGLASGEIDRNNKLLRAIIAEKDRVHYRLLSTVCGPVKGATDFVRMAYAKSIPQAIASGASLREIEIFLETNQLTACFDGKCLFGRGMYANAKPHPDSFEAGFLSLGLEDDEESRARVVAFEDDPKGVASAKQAGLLVCGVKTRFTEGQFRDFDHAPDFFVDTFEEILVKKQLGDFTF